MSSRLVSEKDVYDPVLGGHQMMGVTRFGYTGEPFAARGLVYTDGLV